jgi:Protein of unknown function (DUF3891)
MILRPLQPPPPGTEFGPAWTVVERLQRQQYDRCWMITQPSHAAFSGELAGKLSAAQLPKLDAALVRAIALHDAGWGVPDAQQIMQSRSVNGAAPNSFIDCSVGEFLFAWEKSIDIAAGVSPAGGYMVSRHFHRLAEQRLTHSADNQSDRTKLTRFVEDESRRQQQLAAKQEKSQAELDVLTDVLQFCDLLSLYICCGARDRAEFPECFGVKVRLTVDDEVYTLDPPVIEPGAQFTVAALLHPASKGVSGQQITVSIRGK